MHDLLSILKFYKVGSNNEKIKKYRENQSLFLVILLLSSLFSNSVIFPVEEYVPENKNKLLAHYPLLEDYSHEGGNIVNIFDTMPGNSHKRNMSARRVHWASNRTPVPDMMLDRERFFRRIGKYQPQ